MQHLLILIVGDISSKKKKIVGDMTWWYNKQGENLIGKITNSTARWNLKVHWRKNIIIVPSSSNNADTKNVYQFKSIPFN